MNTAVLLGDEAKARFDCKTTTEYTEWSENTVANDRWLTFGGNLPPQVEAEGYSLGTDNGALNLTVPANSLQQVGDFNCLLLFPATRNAFAKLVILGKAYEPSTLILSLF